MSKFEYAERLFIFIHNFFEYIYIYLKMNISTNIIISFEVAKGLGNLKPFTYSFSINH
jgi:hypothetical protein